MEGDSGTYNLPTRRVVYIYIHIHIEREIGLVALTPGHKKWSGTKV